RVPEQITDHVIVQIGEGGAHRVAGRLHEHAVGVVSHEIADVRLNHRQIRKRKLVPGEVDIVVPDGDVRADAAPVLYIVVEAAILRTIRIRDRMQLATFDTTELDLHVRARADGLRWL